MAEFDCVTAAFEIVTPMFLGGADQQANGVRAQSFKGELAFWWRALHFGNYLREQQDNIDSALGALHADEQILFGGPKQQGAFLLSIRNEKYSKSDQGETLHPAVGEGARYLGYGLMQAFGKNAGELTRSCLMNGSTFDIAIRFRPVPRHTDQNVRERMNGRLRPSLVRALKLMGLVGGLGSRKRRGWGSLAMTTLDGVNCLPATIEDYQLKLDELIERRSETGVGWPLTAFAKETDIRIGTETDGNALKALTKVGNGFLQYRARGHPKGKVGNLTVEANFVDDHDWYKQINKFDPAKGGRGTYVPARTAFGLPHNYDSKKFGVTSAMSNSDRRASPLMIHIQTTKEGYIPVLSFFHTAFLPGEVKVWEKGAADIPLTYNFDPYVVSNFLDGKQPDGRASPNGAYFPARRLWP